MTELLSQPAIHRYIIAAIFMLAGIMHFIIPGTYVKIMPDYIPYHRLMVYISGVAEIVGGLGVLIPQTQLLAAWGLILLLLAVFPANIEMTLQAYHNQGVSSFYFWATVARLPLQFLLIYWVYWACIQS